MPLASRQNEPFYSHALGRQMRRAVANGHGLAAGDGTSHQNTRRMGLASALGNAGDLEGEAEQVGASRIAGRLYGARA